MKHALSIVLYILLLTSSIRGENIDITFTSKWVTLKKINVENTFRGISFDIKPTNVLRLRILSGIDTTPEIIENLSVFPNPIDESAHISFNINKTEKATIQVINTDGKIIHTFHRLFSRGRHVFKLSGLRKGLYLINLITENKRYHHKVISINNVNNSFSFDYIYYNGSENFIDDSTMKAIRIEQLDTLEMEFSCNEILKFTAFSNDNTSDTIIASPVNSQEYVFGFDNYFPDIFTDSVSRISPIDAVTGGIITSDKGSLVTARGICWNTTEDPNINDNKTSEGFGAGQFSSTLTNLSPNTTYYFRAYCTNSLGIAYGKQRSFTTGTIVPDSLNFLQSSDVFFYSGNFDFNKNMWEDISGNKNDAKLVQSNCGTVKTLTELVFSEPLKGALSDWTLTSNGSAKAVLSSDKIIFTKAGTIYNIRIKNNTTGNEYFYPCSEGILTAYDCSGNSNHLIVAGSNAVEWTATKQDDFHYNLKKGGGLKIEDNLVTNPLMGGSYTSGLAPNWIDFKTTAKEEEQNIVMHDKAQRFRANNECGIRTNIDLKKVKAGCFLQFSAWVYVISGKAKANLYGYKSTSQSYLETQSTKIREWEKIEFSTTVHTAPVVDILASVLAAKDNSEIIVGEVTLTLKSNEIIVPALENESLDILKRPLEVAPNTISKVETSIKFPVNDDLINADRNNFLFNDFRQANIIKLRDILYPNVNMVYENTMFCSQKHNEFIIFKSPLGNGTQLRSLLNKWGESQIKVFKNPAEMSINYLENICVKDVNRNFRVGTKNWGNQIVISSDYGKTWSDPLFYDAQLGVHQIYITSKGSVLVFYKGSIIKRLPLGASKFEEIRPLDEKGEIIQLHNPVNPNYPGEYFKPYHKLLDLYDPADDSNLIVWGNWGNNLGAKGASPTGVFYSNDDCKSIRRFYYFGQNNKYTDTGGDVGKNGKLLGNLNNPIITRHVHEVSYNKYNNKIYITCGDDDDRPELHIFETSYNKLNNTWAPFVDLISDKARCQIHRAIGIGFDENGYLYFGSDADPQIIKQNGNHYDSQGVYKVHINDINNISKYVLLHKAKNVVVNFYMNNNYMLFTSAENNNLLYISLDKGKTWQQLDISEYLTSWYPYDFNTSKSDIQLIKEDDQHNIFLKAPLGIYLNQ